MSTNDLMSYNVEIGIREKAVQELLEMNRIEQLKPIAQGAKFSDGYRKAIQDVIHWIQSKE